MLTIEIDEGLLAEAMAATGQPSPQAAIEEALHRIIRSYRQKIAIDQMAGFGWDGDLDSMREGRPL